MSVTIGSLTLDRLQVQPLIYNEVDVIVGNTSRGWQIQGLVTGAEWLSLLNIYNTWRDAKITEESPRSSKVQGTTVSFTGTGFGGQTWTAVPCWFQSAPVGTQSGAFVSATFSLIDAAQAIQSFVREEEDAAIDTATGSINYGTITLGGVSITLTSYPDVFLNSPTLELSAGGKHYVTGPLQVINGKQIEGEIPATSLTALRSWYATTIVSTPAVGQYFPISAPEFAAFNKTVAGVQVLYYTVSMTVAEVV
jgi:hypothetical protein